MHTGTITHVRREPFQVRRVDLRWAFRVSGALNLYLLPHMDWARKPGRSYVMRMRPVYRPLDSIEETYLRRFALTYAFRALLRYVAAVSSGMPNISPISRAVYP